MTRWIAAFGVGVLLVGAAACSDDDQPDTATTTTTPTVAPSDTTVSTPADEDTTTTTTIVPVVPGPGDPCDAGTPDCVEDAWGDGIARLVVGYDECVAAVGEEAGICSDLDQDGYSGYPDSG